VILLGSGNNCSINKRKYKTIIQNLKTLSENCTMIIQSNSNAIQKLFSHCINIYWKLRIPFTSTMNQDYSQKEFGVRLNYRSKVSVLNCA